MVLPVLPIIQTHFIHWSLKEGNRALLKYDSRLILIKGLPLNSKKEQGILCKNIERANEWVVLKSVKVQVRIRNLEDFKDMYSSELERYGQIN